MPPLEYFPALNAALNSASFIFLLLGYFLVRQRAITGHTISMLAACTTSTLFLACYLYYHAHHGSTPFPGKGWTRPVYFTILISHTILAAIVPPLAIRALYLVLRGRVEKHAAAGRCLLPLWLYVSITGVVIYWMLYRVKWNA